MESARKPGTDKSRDATPSVDPHEPTAAASPSDPGGFTGRILDQRYRIVRLLGEGGMGAVFVAEQLTLHKAVALKVIRAELAGNGEVAARFAREAMATAQFEHPHVASAIDYGTLPEGGAYFVMQLVRGQSLRTLIGDGKRLPWRRAAELCAQVADALSAAESASIIHRDLKPDNILVERREDGSDLVKILDFGIAHVAPRDAGAPTGALTNRQLTRVGTVMGTPGYMSPEQAVGDKVDHRTDLYALGVVLWECIAGRDLWDGPDLTTVVARQMGEAVPTLRELGLDASIPAEIDDLVQRLTARLPSQRPEHAAEVRDTLRRLAITRSSPLAPMVSAISPALQHVVHGYRAQPRALRYLEATAAVLLLGFALVLGLSPKPPRAGGTTFERLLRAASVTSDDPKPKTSEPSLPPELAEPAATLLEADTFRERRAAADKILAYQPRERVFPHLRLIAELETARGCKGRKEVIAKMQAEHDVRYLPSLQRLARAPRSGCGFLNLGDCYGCVRADVRSAINAIEQAHPEVDKADTRAD